MGRRQAIELDLFKMMTDFMFYTVHKSLFIKPKKLQNHEDRNIYLRLKKSRPATHVESK
jgi:hypothetical protein